MNWIAAGSIGGFLGVALGAFGVHALRPVLSDSARVVYQTAVQYQLVHSIALVLAGLLQQVRGPGTALNAAGWAFGIGIIVFSGSLYGLSLSGQRWLGAVTPFGGLAFLVGWASLATAALPPR